MRLKYYNLMHNFPHAARAGDINDTSNHASCWGEAFYYFSKQSDVGFLPGGW